MQIYNEKKSQFEIKRNNPKDLVERVARDISKLLNSKSKALEVRESSRIVSPVCKLMPCLTSHMHDGVFECSVAFHTSKDNSSVSLQRQKENAKHYKKQSELLYLPAAI